MHAPTEFPIIAADILARLRAQSPRVHCITNTVAQAFTANMLLAAGALPSMTIAPEEIAHFVVGARALLVNLGTFGTERRQAVEIALAEATKVSLSWVLDPVLIDRSEPRAAFARALVERAPAAVRLNGAEFTALAGVPPEAEALADFARKHGAVIALTGATDVVSDGTRRAMIANGHALMARVTALGCVASALVAACLAVERDAWRASAAALLALGVAGELAAQHARGPGSFAVAIIDALAALDRNTLLDRARVS